jgi:hypothetical protein
MVIDIIILVHNQVDAQRSAFISAINRTQLHIHIFRFLKSGTTVLGGVDLRSESHLQLRQGSCLELLHFPPNSCQHTCLLLHRKSLEVRRDWCNFFPVSALLLIRLQPVQNSGTKRGYERLDTHLPLFRHHFVFTAQSWIMTKAKANRRWR